MHCWARSLFIAVVSVLGIGQMIAACGQKGDLYLRKPDKETPQPAATSAETDAVSPVAETAASSDVPQPGPE